MSELTWFRREPEPARWNAIASPWSLHEMIEAWHALRPAMVRQPASAFTRPEWAYLADFVDRSTLRGALTQAFGEPADPPALPATFLVARPLGPVALWLPANASLLGPLTLILVSLSGNRVRAKASARATDLAGAFLSWVGDHTSSEVLRRYVTDWVQVEVFDRADPRNQEMAREARVRIVFGDDETVRAIDALPHPPGARLLAFGNRTSQAWLHPDRLSDEVVRTLLDVFAVYGQAGCTSPHRVVLIEGSAADADALVRRLAETWDRLQTSGPPPHVSSTNVMSEQLARIAGWRPVPARLHGAHFAAGTLTTPPFEGPFALRVVPATFDQAAASLPANLQTLGVAIGPEWAARLARLAAESPALRIVPLAKMHHFGGVWDGYDIFSQLFDHVSVTPA